MKRDTEPTQPVACKSPVSNAVTAMSHLVLSSFTSRPSSLKKPFSIARSKWKKLRLLPGLPMKTSCPTAKEPSRRLDANSTAPIKSLYFIVAGLFPPWSDGTKEWWSDGVQTQYSCTPSLHSSKAVELPRIIAHDFLPQLRRQVITSIEHVDELILARRIAVRI